MKKLFLLLAAFTCMPTYTTGNKDNNNTGWIIVGSILLTYSTYYICKNYYNTPTNNTSQQTNTSDENSNSTSKNVTVLDITNPTANDSNDALNTYLEKKNEERHKEIAQLIIELSEQKNKVETPCVAIPVIEKITQAETHKKSSSGYFDKKVVNMMLNI